MSILLLYLAVRTGFSFLHSAQKLFQQWVLDAYLIVEGSRLAYIRTHQNDLRMDSYRGLQDYLATHPDSNVPPGRMFILPSTFSGSPRNMHQHCQDAMAIVRRFGIPHYFITFTCNPKWPEIVNNIPPHQGV